MDLDHDIYRKELTRAMRSLARRPRSTAGFVAILEERELPHEWIDEIVSELTSHGFLNDERFAEAYARSRLERLYGPDRVVRELVEMGIGEAPAEQMLARLLREDFDEDKTLAEALARRLRVKGEPETPRQLKNLSDFLLRRGFRPQMVREALDVWFGRILGG